MNTYQERAVAANRQVIGHSAQDTGRMLAQVGDAGEADACKTHFAMGFLLGLDLALAIAVITVWLCLVPTVEGFLDAIKAIGAAR